MNTDNNNMQQPENPSRRTFVQVALGGIGLCYAGAIGYPVYRYLKSPIEKAEGGAAVTEVTLAEAKKLAPGSVLMFKFGSLKAMLIHHKDDSWVALTSTCTHLGCTVQYEVDQDRIYCACHGGVYNAHTGGNVSGPPPKPLDKFEVKLTDAGVVVSKAPKKAA